MRPSRGGRNNWQRFQQQQYRDDHQRPPPAPPSVLQRPFQPPHAPHVQRDVAAFVEAFRANQSSLSAPPNALTLDVVVRAICSHFRVNTFEELLGFSALQLPALRQLHTVNQRVWTFVTCFMQSRRIHTLHECQQAFLQHEGLRSFHELKLGNSFLHTEAVQALYHSPVAMMKLTTKDVLSALKQFEDMLGHDAFRASSHIDLNEFLQFLAQQYRQPSAQAMGVAIDPAGFGVYVGMLRRVANNEMKELKTLEQQFQREVAEKMFRLTKEKFSDDNRKQALDELLEQTNARFVQDNDEGSHKMRNSKKSGMQSLSLDMLKRVTDIDVYLDNVLRRKAAADAKSPNKFRKPISSQEIAETDSKLRNQMTRFLVSSQKSKHHSRLKVVTWVICSIMAKTYAVLLSDDKLPDEEVGEGDGSEAANKISESDKEECDCCCVGKDSCTCSCTCKCHVESSDEEDEEDQEAATNAEEESTASGTLNKFPVMPTDPFASRLGKIAPETEVTLEELKTEVESFFSSQDDEPRTAKDVLLILSSLENHLAEKFSAKPNTAAWAGRRSMLAVLGDFVDETEDDISESESSAGISVVKLLRCVGGNGNGAGPSLQTSERRLQEVLRFVRECRSTLSSSSLLSSLSNEEQRQWMAHRIAVELGCSRAEDIGLPSVDEMIKLADEEPAREEASVVKYAGSFDLAHGKGNLDDAVASEEGESMQQKFLSEQALEKLRKCPYLVDVSLYMDWQERYAPLCGSLLSFIRVHEMILFDHAPSSSNFMFVCCLNGTILRVNEKSTPSDLELLLTRAQQARSTVTASQVAIHLVSMVVTCQGQANFPKQLVQAHLRSYFSSVVKDKPSGVILERFVLEVLLETPVEFGDFVMGMLLDVISQAAGTNEWGVADHVWKACKSDAERKALVFICNRSASPLWTSQTGKWCTVRENLTTTYVEESTDNAAVDIRQTTAEISTDAATNADEDESMTPSILDTSNREVALANFNSVSTLENEGSPQPDSSASADKCRLFIEDLRRQQFGVGLQILDEATTSVLLIQQQRLERALKRLSDELYSESTHFVLELLQNADDNTYDDAVVPLGDFTLTADKEIVFYNNEQGFSQANIQAICDVGASTKAAIDSEASIGKKGIGFKSVFKVSDNPQVHSNGFHICFHAKNSNHGTGMGYILPYWLDDTSHWKQRRGTTFVLPLNAASTQRADDISQSLMAFEPSVLLFLRRIRELRLRDSARDHSLHFIKKEKRLQANSQLVQLYAQTKQSQNKVEVVQQNWLVVKEKLDPPQLFGRTHPTEIALAFPLVLQREDSSQPADRPPLQQVFAYLPLRSYGFRFILQGDFEIPSSREAITNGSDWNEWIVSKFPKLVRAAVSSYVSSVRAGQTNSDDSDKTIAAISHLLSLLPLENEVQAPFRSVIPEIMRELRQVKWLACASSTASSTSGDLFMPAELIDCIELTGSETSENMALLMEALSEDVIASTFNKRFLHPSLSRGITALMKSQLRIEQLHSSHLMRILSLAAEKNNINWTVKILTLLSKLWRKGRHASLLRQELRLIKCFPLQRKSKNNSTRWISLAEGHDSLFVSSIQGGDGMSRREKSYEFYGDLRILDDDFTMEVNKSSKLRAFLMKYIGIHVMEDHDLIRHHILPKMSALRSPTEDSSGISVAEPDVGIVIEFGKFLSSHMVSCGSCPMRVDVKPSMVVATRNGGIAAANRANLFVILPSILKEMAQLVSWVEAKMEIFGQDEDVLALVSSSYFADVDSENDLTKKPVDTPWQKLFVDICELPLLIDAASLKTDTRLHSAMEQLLKWIDAEEDIEIKRSISMCLAQYFDKHWGATEDDCDLDATDCDDTQTRLYFWRQYHWLEGSDGEFYRPTELWLPVETTARLFTRSMVTFCSMTWKNEHFSKHILGMKVAPTAADVLTVLSSCSLDPALTATLEVDQMIRVYSFLWEESQRSEACRDNIAKAFLSKMMIFVLTGTHAQEITPRFVGVKSVVWSSTTHNGELVALETLYPKTLCEFFTEVCGVQHKPSVSFLCEMITEQHKHFAGEGSDDVSDKMNMWKKKVLPLLGALSKKVKKRSLSKTETKEIKQTLKSTLWLPVRSIGEASNNLVFCCSKDLPVQAATDSERKLQKLVLSLAKEVAADSFKKRKKRKDEEDIKMVPLDAFGDDGELDALLRFAKVGNLTKHIKAHASVWCKALCRFVKSTQLDSKKGRKKLIKLEQLLVKAWANAYATSSCFEDPQFQWCAQHLDQFFLTIDEEHRWASAAEMYINNQVDLSKDDLQQPGQTEQLQVLGLFPWEHFVDSEDDEATRVQKFLTEFCGMKPLKDHLQYEVSVLSTQHAASEAFHEKLRSAFALSQRFLFHNHRHLYGKLNHDSMAKLASQLQCMLVDGHDGFQVVYRVGNSFSVRRGVDAMSNCFLDVPNSTLYMQFVTGDEEASALSPVLMEISRKLFGAQVASPVANLLYLSLLQPNAIMREKWLVETQLLPPLPDSEDTLWAEQSEDTFSCSTSGVENRKRSMEDGEIDVEEGPTKKLYAPSQQNNEATQGPPYPPLPASTNFYNSTGNGPNYGMQVQRPLYPPLPPNPVNGSAEGAPYHPPFPPSLSGSGMQSLSLSNTMTKEEREAIGRWGEEYVFNQLKQQHADSESNMTVEWVNEKEESGLPYDLTVSSGGKVVEYVEVKSTRTMEKGVFEISMNELDQAAIHGSTYCIYRVFNAGNPALCRVIRMKNPVSLVRQRKIQLALVMQ